MYMYMHIYIYMCVYVFIYVLVYISIHIHRWLSCSGYCQRREPIPWLLPPILGSFLHFLPPTNPMIMGTGPNNFWMSWVLGPVRSEFQLVFFLLCRPFPTTPQSLKQLGNISMPLMSPQQLPQKPGAGPDSRYYGVFLSRRPPKIKMIWTIICIIVILFLVGFCYCFCQLTFQHLHLDAPASMVQSEWHFTQQALSSASVLARGGVVRGAPNSVRLQPHVMGT